MICDNTSKGIPSTLQFVLIETWQTSKQRVTKVQTTTNQGICSKDCHLGSKILSYSTKVRYLEKVCFVSLLDLFREGKCCIKPHTVNHIKKASKNIDRKVRENFLTLSLRTKNNKFSFFRVKLQFTESHQSLHILKAGI